MRVAFVLPTLAPSGGIHVALRHARALRDGQGWDVAVVVDEAAPDGAPAGVRVVAAAAAVAEEWDVVVSTWWTTWATAVELPARRRVVVLQGDEVLY